MSGLPRMRGDCDGGTREQIVVVRHLAKKFLSWSMPSQSRRCACHRPVKDLSAIGSTHHGSGIAILEHDTRATGYQRFDQADLRIMLGAHVDHMRFGCIQVDLLPVFRPLIS